MAVVTILSVSMIVCIAIVCHRAKNPPKAAAVVNEGRHAFQLKTNTAYATVNQFKEERDEIRRQLEANTGYATASPDPEEYYEGAEGGGGVERQLEANTGYATASPDPAEFYESADYRDSICDYNLQDRDEYDYVIP